MRVRTIVWFLVGFAVLFIGISAFLFSNGSNGAWGFAWLVFTLLSLLTFCFLLILGLRIAQRDGFLHGFRKGNDHAQKS